MLIAAVVAVLAFGAWRAGVDGRFRGTHAVKGSGTPEPTDGPDGPPGLVDRLPADIRLGERATLLQFSTAFCAPCRATRRTLAEIAEIVPGVAHVEIDAEHHLDLVRRLQVLRTPTTLILDGDGREVSRAAGAPRKEQVLGALARVSP